MLDLDDPRWASLEQAYGSAEDIPPLLRAMERDPFALEQEVGVPWFDLWSALWHQGSIYSGSFAAVPHIIQIARKAASREDKELPCDFFLLPASIEMTRRLYWSEGEIPPFLLKPYLSALAELHDLAFGIASRPWSAKLARCVAGALMVERGELNFAEVLIDWDESELQIAKRLRDNGFDAGSSQPSVN